MWPIKISIKSHHFQWESAGVVTNAVKIVTSHQETHKGNFSKNFLRPKWLMNFWLGMASHHIWMNVLTLTLWLLSKMNLQGRSSEREKHFFGKINVHRFIIRRWKVHWKKRLTKKFWAHAWTLFAVKNNYWEYMKLPARGR